MIYIESILSSEVPSDKKLFNLIHRDCNGDIIAKDKVIIVDKEEHISTNTFFRRRPNNNSMYELAICETISGNYDVIEADSVMILSVVDDEKHKSYATLNMIIEYSLIGTWSDDEAN